MELPRYHVGILLPLVAEFDFAERLFVLRRGLESRELEVIVKVTVELLGQHAGRRG